MDFTVPAGDGDYAPEVYYVTEDGIVESPGQGPLDKVLEIQINLIQLPADAQLEMDLLDPDKADYPDHVRWRVASQVWTDAGLQTPVALTYWPGVRFRMKSGGTGGVGTFDARHA